MLRMTRTRTLLFSIMGLAIVGAGIGAGTFAFFTGSADSTSNTFAAGTLTLLLSDVNETDQATVSASWTATNFAPGDTATGFLMLKNSGTVAADHLDIAVANIVTDDASPPGSTSTTPIDEVLKITLLCYDSNGDTDCLDGGESDLLAGLSDLNANGIIDLDDLENEDAEGSEDLTGLALTDLTTDHRLDMTVEFDATLGVNEHQGDDVTTVLTVLLNQDSTQ